MPWSKIIAPMTVGQALPKHLWLLLLMVAIGPIDVIALDNGLARTPPMGWLSWERFLCEVDCKTYPDSCISERLYTSMADIIVNESYADAGYKLVNIDDCWMSSVRDFDGTLQANYTRFPHGIKWLADYVHSKGLQLGIYQDCGTKTCQGYPGSQDFFEKDAQTYAQWEVDMLKLDGCYADQSKMDTIYPQMTRALNKTGRPIIFSCSWPAYQFQQKKPDYESIAKHCNMWRNFDDITDTWDSVLGVIEYYAKNQDDFIQFSGPGAWNDPDMLVIGNYGLSLDQARTQMAMWAIFAAPLFISADLRTIDPAYKKILLNRDVIAVNQDSYGIMGHRIYNKRNIQIWIRPVGPRSEDGSMSAAIVMLNTYSLGGPTLVNVSLSSIGMNYEAGYFVSDLFGSQIVDRTYHPNDYIAVRVSPSGVVMLKCTVRPLSEANDFANRHETSTLRIRSTEAPNGAQDDGSSSRDQAELDRHQEKFHMSSMGYGPMQAMLRPPKPKHLSEVGYDAFATHRRQSSPSPQ